MNKKPNVIFVLADDMGYGDFSAFNPNGPTTPALDRLVREGITLSNCYSASPVCAPARAAIMTGRYPQRTGVIDTLEARGYDRLKLSETTLADLFRDNGYETALIGKWHLGAISPEYHPNRRGFDYFCGFRGGWSDYYDYHIERNGSPIPCDGTYLTDFFSNEAVSYVNTHKDKPFFLHLAYNAPHFPLEAPDEVIRKYRDKGIYTEAVCMLYAMIEIMDQGLGRLLSALDDLGIAENTIVVFLSDNGPDMGGEGDACQARYNCDLRGEKMYVYEGGIKVPGVVRWSGNLASSVICDAVFHGTDWLPTLLSMCDIKVPQELNLDGLDMFPVLKGAPGFDRTLYWQWNRYVPEFNCNAAVRKGDYKLVHAPVYEYLDLPSWEVDIDVDIKRHPEKYTDINKSPIPLRKVIDSPDIQLFDLKTDPNEKTDIAADNPAMVAEMEQSLHDWFTEVEAERKA